ncbi:MAG: zinc-dependent alcohol dehydrogenase family protein, partial [Gemmataceae bacterium]
QVRDMPAPEPKPGQVRVRMVASPINPSDLLVVRGAYGWMPALPATPGFEGVGVVEANGGGLLGRLWLGRRVVVISDRGGNWRERNIVPARQVVPVAADIPDEQAASFFVNPASALVMTRYLLNVPRGAWLLQTAAGSALGRMVIRLGKYYGFRTINVVRRREQADQLLQLGGDEVICTADEIMEKRVKAITGGQMVPFALDAVGGATGTSVVTCLGAGGRMLVYGLLSGEPIILQPRVLMTGQKSIAGFWLAEWAKRQRILTMLRLFRRIAQLMRKNVLTSPIAGTYGLADIAVAVQQAETPGREGKIILKCSGDPP